MSPHINLRKEHQVPEKGEVVTNWSAVREKAIGPDPDYGFRRRAARILNSGQSRSLMLTGNIHDLFFAPEVNGFRGDYVPLAEYLRAKWHLDDRILVMYQMNSPLKFADQAQRDKVKEAWVRYRSGLDPAHSSSWKDEAAARLKELGTQFDRLLTEAAGKPSLALEALRQMCLCSRAEDGDGVPLLPEHLIIVIEGADMIIPEGEISRLSEADRHRVAICRDWLSDPGFMSGGDIVVLISESRNLVNQRVSKLPQMLRVDIPSPDEEQRRHCIAWFDRRHLLSGGPERPPTTLEGGADLVKWTAGLSVHALFQLLKGAAHQGGRLTSEEVVDKVEAFIKSQLGEEVVQFKKPAHRLEDLVGNRKLKTFIGERLIPRFRASGRGALSGAIVCGPLGVGKTYIFEAVAAELGMPVLVLKGIRSKWFGETDLILERLRRVLEALSKALIFVDEADTSFSDVSGEPHSTERRVTGQMLAMMSDPRLKGRILWLLMTARVHLLPPDMLRPGRVGDLIIPVLDPEGEDRDEFIAWTLQGTVSGSLEGYREELEKLTRGYSAASFALLRGELRAEAGEGQLSPEQALEVARDIIPPSISETRRYQTLQALLNCTRRSLLPDRPYTEADRKNMVVIDPRMTDADRDRWLEEVRQLEAEGIR
ncbi:hypothetical protein AMJ57_00495 [Parcubacteria bacterium SG8_24]|nr:MAG: hypothetical protein AMJ57_00495 [Parcubacteria bacterium SG8_24]